MSYDLIVIGGGPAGYHAAELAGHKGLKTILFEKKFIGGVCLNEGCIPSKTLLYSAKLLDNALGGEKYGLTVEHAKLDHEKVLERKNKVVRTLVTGIRSGLKRAGVEIIEAEAKISGSTSGGFEVISSGNAYHAKKILVATGSNPIKPPIKGIDEGMENNFIITSSEVFKLENIPDKMTIIGAGIIGLEMASYFNSLGSEVTVMEMLSGIAGNIDAEVGAVLLNNYKKKGVTFKLSTMVTEIGKDFVEYRDIGSTGSPAQMMKTGCVLLCTGRKPNTENIGLENVGVKTEKGAVITDEYGKTNIDGIYAAGDVNGQSMLAHTAYREAEVCINAMTGNDDVKDYRFIPSIIYVNPEVAQAGESEESCVQKNIQFDVVKLPLRFSGRYLAENEMGDGICKMLCDKQKRLIGFHMIGNYSSEMIYGLSMMMEKEMTMDDLKKIVFPHPTVSEIIKECAFQLG